MSKEIDDLMEERVLPARITDNDTDKVYELDFSRDSVRFAEQRGFELESVTKFPVSKVPELFYFSFRKNHKNLAKEKTDALLDKMGGLSAPLLGRLMQLYQQAQLTHIIATDEDAAKNESVTVEM